jgi:hypothetical protein
VKRTLGHRKLEEGHKRRVVSDVVYDSKVMRKDYLDARGRGLTFKEYFSNWYANYLATTKDSPPMCRKSAKAFFRDSIKPPYKYTLETEELNLVRLKKGYLPDSRFDAVQLKRGTKVEKEHTNNISIAKQIAKAHLYESPDYYKKLAVMEKSLGR